MMRAINLAGLSGRSYPEQDSLFIKLSGSETSIADATSMIREIVTKHEGKGFEFAHDEKEAQGIWEGRKVALWSARSLREGSRIWTTDVW